MSGVLRLSNNVTGRSTIIASASNDQTFTLPATGGTLLAGGSSLEVIFPSGTEALPGLHVESDVNTGLYSPTANTLGISTDGSERMRIDSSGNVGIGTSSPQHRLSVERDVGIYRASSDPSLSLSVGGTIASPTKTYYLLIDDSDSDKLQIRDGSTARVTLDSSGNVGIGTSAPNAALTVHGSAGNAKIRLGQGGDHTIIGPNASGHTVINAGTAGGNMQFETAGTERLRIDSSGNVGIGTSSPSQSWTGTSAHVVQIEGASSQITVLRINENNGSNGDLQLISTINNEVGIYNFNNGPMRFGTNAAERMRIDSSGRLLVGTTTSSGSALCVIQGLGRECDRTGHPCNKKVF